MAYNKLQCSVKRTQIFLLHTLRIDNCLLVKRKNIYFHRYTTLSAKIASTAELEILVRHFYFEEMMMSIKKNLTDKDPVQTDLHDCFRLISSTLLPSERGYITDNKVQCKLVFESLLPKDVACTKATICVDPCEKLVKNKTDLSVQASSNESSDDASSFRTR